MQSGMVRSDWKLFEFGDMRTRQSVPVHEPHQGLILIEIMQCKNCR